MGFVLTQLSFLAAGVVLAVRFGRSHQRGWAIACGASVVGAVAVPALGDPSTLAVRLVVSAGLELGLVSALALGSQLQRVR